MWKRPKHGLEIFKLIPKNIFSSELELVPVNERKFISNFRKSKYERCPICGGFISSLYEEDDEEYLIKYFCCPICNYYPGHTYPDERIVEYSLEPYYICG